jgi:hypothetical protein
MLEGTKEHLMETIILLGMLVLGIGLTVWAIQLYAARKILTARSFAGIFAIGSSVTVLVICFLPRLLEGTPLESETIGFGLGATVLDFLVGYPMSYLFYLSFRRFLR